MTEIKNPTFAAGFFFSYRLKQSIVVVMAALLDNHDLGIVIAPAIVMAARPQVVEAAIMVVMLRDYNCSILCICSYGWQRNGDRAHSSQSDKKFAEPADTKFRS